MAETPPERRLCSAAFRAVEEGTPVVGTGQRIRLRQTDQFLLHRDQALGRPEPRVQLLGAGRLLDEIVGATVERLGQAADVARRRHGDDVQGAAPLGEQARRPAELEPAERPNLKACDQDPDRRRRGKEVQGLRGIREGVHVVAPRLDQRGDDLEHDAARVDDDDLHGVTRD